MDKLAAIFALYGGYLADLSQLLIDPGEPLFLPYLLSAAAIAYLLRRARALRRDDGAPTESIREVLFPDDVWSHPSALLDVRYFLFHHLIGHFLLFGLMAASSVWAFALVTGGQSLAEMTQRGDAALGGAGWLVAVGYMIVVFAVIDLVAFGVHYLQHKVPILWEFHKVHHSAEVMHPLSNFREHPVDNLAYQLAMGAGLGAMMGLGTLVFGILPSMPAVFGVPLLAFLFNALGYNLRHSHIWLRWPGRWSAVFPSPAHHHVHHSCHPEHLDKNFAFMFPMWDVIFGTYTMPETNETVKFGAIGVVHADMDTCWKLYTVPVFKVLKRLRPRRIRALPPTG